MLQLSRGDTIFAQLAYLPNFSRVTKDLLESEFPNSVLQIFGFQRYHILNQSNVTKTTCIFKSQTGNKIEPKNNTRI